MRLIIYGLISNSLVILAIVVGNERYDFISIGLVVASGIVYIQFLRMIRDEFSADIAKAKRGD